MSAFIELAEACKTQLLAEPQIVGDRVTRARQAALKKGWADGINVRLVRTRARLAGVGPGAPKDWTTLIGIECAARAEPGALAEDAVDVILAAAYARLAGWAPADLAVEDVFAEPAIDWDSDDGEDAICRASFIVSVTHRTTAASLTAWGS